MTTVTHHIKTQRSQYKHARTMYDQQTCDNMDKKVLSIHNKMQRNAMTM